MRKIRLFRRTIVGIVRCTGDLIHGYYTVKPLICKTWFLYLVVGVLKPCFFNHSWRESLSLEIR